MLGFFKYGNFLLENTKWLLAQVGIAYQPPHLDLFLPIGISFYTFHSLSYTLDVYRGVGAADEVAARLRAGRLVLPAAGGRADRARGGFPAATASRRPSRSRGSFSWGLLLMTLGLFQKTVLADTLLAGSADTVFNYGGPLQHARRVDRRAGVLRPDLLRLRGLLHLRDRRGALPRLPPAGQLPLPLRGDRASRISGGAGTSRSPLSCATSSTSRSAETARGRCAPAINLMIVMFLGGLWHGAAWTFVVWGLIHGLCLVLERVLRCDLQGRRLDRDARACRLLLGLATYVGGLLRVGLLPRGRFHHRGAAGRAPWSAASRMATPSSARARSCRSALVTAGLLVAHWLLRDTTHRSMRGAHAALARRPRVWALMLCAIILTQGSGNAFIYFQF